MYVRFNRAWLPYILGSLKQLMLQTTWQTDDPDVLNIQQQYAGQILYEFSLASNIPPCDQITGITESEYEMSVCEQLRFHDGKLQGYCCGEWTDIQGQETIDLRDAGQPGGGSEQPTSNGGQACYHGEMRSSDIWLLPTNVNAGDTLTFSNLTGAGSDGTLSWFCPNGSAFFAGICSGSVGFSGTDPAPSIHHMAIVAKIGSVYYDVTAGVITVPGGIVNQPVYVQVNDVTLSGNNGSYAFDVCAVNNEISQFTHHFDFRLSTWGFLADDHSGVSNVAWVAGAGWQSSVTSPVVAHRGDIDLGLNNTHSLVHAVLRMVGTNSNGVSGQYLFQQTAPFPPPTLGEFYTQAVTGAIDFSHSFVAALTRFGVANEGGNVVGDTVTITDVYVTADGVDPF